MEPCTQVRHVVGGEPVSNQMSGIRQRRLCNIWRRLRRDQRGVAAIEFAVVAPAFFFLVFVIAETALVFIAEQVMDNAVFETARLIRTGQIQLAATSDAEFRKQVCDRVSMFIDCKSSNFYLDVRSFPGFADMDVSQPLNADETFKSETAYDFGKPSQVVVLRAYYQWPTNRIFGALSLNNLANGKRLIGSFAAFRNEPYA